MSGLRTRLLTAFGTVVHVDPASGELRHGPIESSPANAWFVAEPGSRGPHRLGRLVHDPGDDSGAPMTLELIPLERGLVALAAGGRFLSANPEGRVALAAPLCSTWELFVPSEAWCTDGVSGAGRFAPSAGEPFDRKAIAGYAIHPMIRARAGTKPKGIKLLVYGYPKWSHGRVYYDLANELHRRGYIVDVLDWQGHHDHYIGELRDYYDLFMTALDGVSTLTGVYGVPFDRIIAVSHHELDVRMLVEQQGMDVFHRFANYGVVSEFLYCASVMRGVPRAPMVASLGINYPEFRAEVPERLATVGYASSMSVKTYGIEWKRGELAARAVHEAGLAFKVAGSTESQMSFHDMPAFYRGVDAVVTSSVSEAAQLPVMEAAAAGRLVIGTPVGHFPLKAYSGGGILAPVEADKFVAFTADTLRYYKDNPAAYVDKCHSIQEAARGFDWEHTIDEWVALIETARAGG